MNIPGFYPQLLSQSGKVRRKVRFPDVKRLVEIVIFSRFSCRRLSQSDHPSSHSACLTLRPLRSTGVTPLHHYYEPLRLPVTATIQVIDSLFGLSALTNTAVGLPSSQLSCPYAPSTNTPESLTGAFNRRFPESTGFTSTRRLATPTMYNEAESVRFRYSSHVRLPRLRPRKLLAGNAWSTTCMTISLHDNLLSDCKDSQA